MDQEDAVAFKNLIQRYLDLYLIEGKLAFLHNGDLDIGKLAYHVVDDLLNENQEQVVEEAKELLQTQLQKSGHGKKVGSMGKSRTGKKTEKAGTWNRWDDNWYDGEWWDWDWNDWGWDEWDNYWYNPYYSYYYYYSWYPYYWWNYNPYSWYDWYYPYLGYSYVGGKKISHRKNKKAGYGNLFDKIEFKDIKEMHMTCDSDNMCTLNLQFQKNNNHMNSNTNGSFLDFIEEDL